MYGSAYTNVPVTTWSTGWSSCCNNLTNPFDIGTPAHGVLKYELHHFVGIEYPALDATTMTHFHVDVWSPNPPGKLQIQLVNHAGGTIIAVYEAVGIAGETWVSLDIPLSSFSPALTNRTGLDQLLFLALDAGGATSSSVVYMDNIYFHK
jgi:hypothetical protein